jgi:uncharacterized protein YfaA (DUF2138 family)
MSRKALKKLGTASFLNSQRTFLILHLANLGSCPDFRLAMINAKPGTRLSQMPLAVRD